MKPLQLRNVDQVLWASCGALVREEIIKANGRNLEVSKSEPNSAFRTALELDAAWRGEKLDPYRRVAQAQDLA